MNITHANGQHIHIGSLYFGSCVSWEVSYNLESDTFWIVYEKPGGEGMEEEDPKPIHIFPSSKFSNSAPMTVGRLLGLFGEEQVSIIIESKGTIEWGIPDWEDID
jgi:hypothetical protein